VSIIFRVTATDLAVSTADGEMQVFTSVAIQENPVNIAGTLIDIDVDHDGEPLTGTQMGVDCVDRPVVFRELGASFEDIGPPYSGVFRPLDPNFLSRLEGQRAGGSTWDLIFQRFDASIRVECFRVELTLERDEPPPLQGGLRNN
jgi:hypothetical protein